ncbi:hypothetical protein L1887_61051 [Cichorium endivia]|nr:hypothetical protein L1887_61051 [Cichorium endivia]
MLATATSSLDANQGPPAPDGGIEKRASCSASPAVRGDCLRIEELEYLNQCRAIGQGADSIVEERIKPRRAAADLSIVDLGAQAPESAPEWPGGECGRSADGMDGAGRSQRRGLWSSLRASLEVALCMPCTNQKQARHADRVGVDIVFETAWHQAPVQTDTANALDGRLDEESTTFFLAQIEDEHDVEEVAREARELAGPHWAEQVHEII